MNHAPSAARAPRARGALVFAALAVASVLPLLGATSGASAASTSPTADAVRWSVVPADADGPDGRISLRHVSDPGQVVTDAVAVTNLGAQPATFAVAAGDGRMGTNGAFDIAPGDPVDAGTWVVIDGLENGSVDVAAGETRVLPVSITVPADATPGDHPAGIVVALSSTDDDVTVTNRVGVRLHLQVAGDLVPQLEVTSVQTEFVPSWIPFGPGTLRVQMDVANTGNVRLGAAPSATAVGANGPVPTGDTVELLPGDTTSVSVETSAWPMLFLFGDARVSAVSIGEDAVPASEAVSQSFVQPAISWTGLAILVLIIGGVVAFIIVRRRRPKTSEVAE